MPTAPDRPLFDAFPQLRGRLPLCALGEFPTPVHRLDPVERVLDRSADLWVKRDDLSSDVYGGNKVRTLEVLFAEAIEAGATHIYSTGAFGTNHGAATVLHAPRVGLSPGLLLFPQPPSAAALENYHALHSEGVARVELLHWSQLPLGILAVHARHRSARERPFIMVPGGATPRGALGYISAALELAHQVDAGVLPAPRNIVVGVGSTCTSAGLLVGLQLAARLGIGWRQPPHLTSVRVTPWPVTSPMRIVGLALRAADLLAELTGDARVRQRRRALRAGLTVDASQLGRGYGHPTAAGRDAIRLFAQVTEGRPLTLDTTYSGKAAAAFIDGVQRGSEGPQLFWSTKSTASLPSPAAPTTPNLLSRWWMRRAEARG